MVVGRAVRLLALVVLAALVVGCAAPGDAPGPTTPAGATTPAAPVTRAPPTLEPYLDGFDAPLLLTHDARGDTFVVEQGGRIWRIEGAERVLWLDVSDNVSRATEQGLLGLAFPAEDVGEAYVSYTDPHGDSVLSRFAYDEVADRASETTLLAVDQPYSNHNGGHVAFGPDGLLYYGLGDGGSAGDPQGNGQDPDALLGSILRLDVTRETPTPEIYAKGLRNPWRFSFGPEGELWIGDVGQNRVEEIDRLPPGAPKGANFGWNVFEGNDRYTLVGRTFSAHTPPVFTYTHDDGCSVTAGLVVGGAFWLSDYCSGKLWRLDRNGEGWEGRMVLETGLRVSSFGTDAAGDAYLVDHGGRIVRLVVT